MIVRESEGVGDGEWWLGDSEREWVTVKGVWVTAREREGVGDGENWVTVLQS